MSLAEGSRAGAAGPAGGSRHALGMLLPVFAATLMLSATLLFSVQPLFTKMVLPLLGGSPAVWNTAMVFFQAALLGGYLYSHILAVKLRPRLQIFLHLAVLGLAALSLPSSLTGIALAETLRGVIFAVVLGGYLVVFSFRTALCGSVSAPALFSSPSP